MKSKKNIFILLFAGLLYLFKADFIFALELRYPQVFGFSINSTSTLPEYARYFFNIGIILAGLIALGSIAFGGIYYLISFSRGKFTSDAKDWIKSSILGLLLVLGAYLIAYAINPNLVFFRLDGLPNVNLGIQPGVPSSPNIPIVSYTGVPMGILTETLLARTTNCYAFDSFGNPIAGDEIKLSNGRKAAGPTFLDHDRADCLLQLTDGANKKAQIIADLSDALMRLSKECDCTKFGDCKNVAPSFPGQCPTPPPLPCPARGNEWNPFSDPTADGLCIDSAVRTPCIPGSKPDCCPKPGDINPFTGDIYEIDVKEAIEHGPIEVKISPDSQEGFELKGLDEFRSDYNYDYNNIVTGAKIFKQAEINGKTVDIIDLGNCQKCKAGNDFERCQEELKKCQEETPWYKLKLVDQLIVLREQINILTKTYEPDKKTLTEAKDYLGKCYLAVSSVDLFETKKETNEKNKVIFASSGFGDDSKYCEGFNYANSDCFQKCNNLCPDTGKKVLEDYAKCKECDPKKNDYQSCLEKQEECITKAYMDRPCEYSEKPQQKYSECIDSCRGDCAQLCQDKYGCAPGETCGTDLLGFCLDQCEDNSKCILDNSEECLLAPINFKECADNVTDPGNSNYCIDKSYLCQNGSDQYAGYTDCGTCGTEGCTASGFYQNPGNQKCPSPYEPAGSGSSCFIEEDPDTSCQTACPETSKCPAASDCPTCSCENINASINFKIPNPFRKNSAAYRGNGIDNAGYEGYRTQQERLLAYTMVNAECNSYSYNSDPLTFYCQDAPTWWKDPNRDGLNQTPQGAALDCSESQEIPIGETVDSSLAWSNNITSLIPKITDPLQIIIQKAKVAGKAKDNFLVKDYCKCNALFDNGDPICMSQCEFSQSVDSTGKWTCGCSYVPCKGKPCQQLTEYLAEIWTAYKDVKTNFITFHTFITKEYRSDLFKKLSYSRLMTNGCSITQNIYKDQNVEMLNCTRAKHEKINSIISNDCYGASLDYSVTDNWYCCVEEKNNISEK